eukprot:591899-Rhodomonas_salina.1
MLRCMKSCSGTLLTSAFGARRLEYRIQLAEELADDLEDVQTLVRISVDEIADIEDKKAHNDAWARQ